MQTSNPKFEFLTDEAIFSMSGNNYLNTWVDSNLQVDKEFKSSRRGTLDGRIFGSCFEGRCNCGAEKHGKCGNCGSEVLRPEVAWGRYGRIDLPFFYCGTYKKPQLVKYLTDNFKIKLDLHVDKESGKMVNLLDWVQVGYDEEENAIILTDVITDHTMCSYDGLLKVISQYFREKLGTYKAYINSSILVAPLPMRAPRYVLEDGVKVLKNNKLTIIYNCILNAVYEQWPKAKTMSEYQSEAALSGFLCCMRTYINQLMDIVNQIVKPNKESLPRTMQSHRMNNSGRCTIIPSPQLKIDEVEIPRHLMYECCKDEFIQYMIATNDWTYERAATQYVTGALYPETQKMFTEYVENGLDGKGKYVIINRNPTLYELGMFCCRVKLTNDYTIGVALGICSPMGGDFDGDTFSFYSVPSSMVDLVKEKMSPMNQFRYKKNQMPLFTPSHEVMGGLIVGSRKFMTDPKAGLQIFSNAEEAKQYKKTHRDFKYQTPCIIDNKETTYARYVLGQLFNVDLDAYLKAKEDDKQDPYITSKDIPYLYSNLADLDDRTDRIQQIQEFALMITTLSGATTPSMKEMHAELPTQYFDRIKAVFESDLTDDEKDLKVTLIYKDFLKEMNAKDKENHYKHIDDDLVRKVSDSARAKVDQLMLIMSPMFTTGPDKRIRVGNTTMLEGMSPTDYTNMAIENRVTQDIKVSATPRSGYTTRQLAYLGNSYKFVDSEEGEINEGIYIPLKLAAGRTRVDGSMVTRKEADRAKKGEMVKVRSVVTSSLTPEFRVAKDCISKYNNWSEGDAVGTSLMTSMTEGLTQSGLSLKHGGHLFELDPLSYIYAPEDGHLELTATDVIFRGRSGKDYVYPRTEKFTKNYQEEDYYKKGEIIGGVYRLVTPSYRLDSIIKLIDAAPTSSNKKIINNAVLMTDCYAFSDGTIHYQRDRDGNIQSIAIGNQVHQFNPAACYWVPEGGSVKKGERFCTGVMDLKSAIHHLNDYVEVFYLFYQQFNELIPGMTPELIEFVYSLTVTKTEYYIQAKSVIKSVKESPGSISRLAFREPKQFFVKIDHKGAEFVADAISNIVLPTIMLNSIL